jgi:hypothetical protein
MIRWPERFQLSRPRIAGMSPVRVLLLVAFILFGLAVPMYFLLVEKTRPGGPGTTLPEPISYAKPTPGGQFILAVFGSAEAEAALKPSEMKRQAEDVRKKYAVPGMYTSDGKLVYPLQGYTPDDNVYLTADGRSVARIEGDWWQTRAYPAGTRLAPEEEQRQLDAPAVSLYAAGKLLKSYPLKELLNDPSVVPHSPKHILWPGGAVLNEKEGRFLVYTQDAQRATFDVRTGEMVAKEPMGFGNRFAQLTMILTLGLTVLLAIGLGFWIWKRRRQYALRPSSQPVEEL